MLNEYTGKDDLVFGVTVSGRSMPLADIESRVGMFINTLPMRVKIEPNLKWCDWLKKVARAQVDLEEYAYTPHHLIQNCVVLPPNQSLFTSNLRFQNYPIAEAGVRPKNQFEFIEFTDVDWWHYPLNFVIMPDLRVKLEIHYDTRFFEPIIVLDILRKVETSLSRFVADESNRNKKLLPD
jgi:non-ribosomal peptide synthetase component F